MRPTDAVNDASNGGGRDDGRPRGAALMPAWLATFIKDAERENETLELPVNREQTLETPELQGTDGQTLGSAGARAQARRGHRPVPRSKSSSCRV